MHRTITALATIFAFLPITASADTFPRTEVGQPIYKVSKIEPIKAPVVAEVAPVEEIPAPEPQPAPAAPMAVTEPVYTPPAPAASVGNCGDNMYKQYIYSHESGCNTDRWNSSGCYGIGQDCNGVVLSKCGADFTCQDEYFSNYAISRYGSWAAAYDFWTHNSWW